VFTQASVAIDGSKFKAVNNRDKNFTRAKMDRRMSQIEESVARYLQQLDTADRQEPSEALQAKTNRLKEKIEKLKEQMRRLEFFKVQMLASPDQQISLTDPGARSMATSGRGSSPTTNRASASLRSHCHCQCVRTEFHFLANGRQLQPEERAQCIRSSRDHCEWRLPIHSGERHQVHRVPFLVAELGSDVDPFILHLFAALTALSR
jgi:hypothetical protein